MSEFAFVGALEIGLIYGLVAIGVFITFRVLDFPDLTVDGSFTLGAAVTATAIVAGINPFLASIMGMLAGGLAGMLTAWLNLKFNILHLLASILTMTALYTINLRVMGKPNVALIMEPTVFDPFKWLPLPTMYLKLFVLLLIVVVIALSVVWFLNTQFGLAMRAVGSNKRMAQANGIDINLKVYLGLALSNGLVGLAGALFAQSNGFADSTMGIGVIVVGLAAVIIGQTLIPSRLMLWIILSCLLGSLIYRLAVAFALNADVIGLKSSDLQLITAVLVSVALILPKLKNDFKAKMAARRQHD